MLFFLCMFIDRSREEKRFEGDKKAKFVRYVI